jgi:histidyl-tRNA synthetase
VDGVRRELEEKLAISAAQATSLLRHFTAENANFDSLQALQKNFDDHRSDAGAHYVNEVLNVLSTVASVSTAFSKIQFDPSITRGLDYYTGIVVETQLDDLPSIGSVASGGRYDNLAGLYTKQSLPGVGASLGLDRLLAALEELGKLPAARTPAPVIVCMFTPAHRKEYLKLAAQIRAAGIGVEVYPEAKKLGKQLQYADRQGFRAAIIIGENEFAAHEAQVKDLASGGSTTVAYDGADASPLVAELRRLLSA